MKKHEKLVKVKAYLDRLKRDKALPNYPLDEEGFFGIFPGFYQTPPGNEPITVIAGFSKKYHKIQVYRGPVKQVIAGRFIDVVAYAVSQPYLYSVGSNNPGDDINGFIEKLDTIALEEDPDLESLVEREALAAQ